MSFESTGTLPGGLAEGVAVFAVSCAGNNTAGQLGNGQVTPSMVPVAAPIPEDAPVTIAVLPARFTGPA